MVLHLTSKLELKRPSLHLDYFSDYKDRICQVLTWHHPTDRRLCIVKYDIGSSFWISRETGIQYTRILKSYSLEGQIDNLLLVKKIEPSYVYHSIVYGVDFLAVPNERIKQYYYPEERLEEILATSDDDLDEIELKVKVLADLLNKYLKIPMKNMGITGSILWKGQTEKSDIDFMIYGNEYAQDFNEKFPILYEKNPEIQPMSPEKTKRYEESAARKSGISSKLTRKYISRKRWLSVFGDTNLSIIFSPLSSELPFAYGDQIFTPIKAVDVECFVTNAAFGSVYPSIYEITDCKLLSTNKVKLDSPLERILSFEGALTGFFKNNDKIVVRGLLEKVVDKKNNRQFYQILLGTQECSGNEFILYPEDYLQLKK